MFKKYLFRLLLAAGVIALGSVMLRPPPYRGPLGERAPDIVRPDALIRSYSLSKLPVDLLRIPLAHDVLTEEFVAYYEQNADRMAVSGALRRIAFEHRQDISERLVESALDEPAEIALWRDEAGRLRDFVLVLRLNALARIIQTILPVAVKATDAQLTTAGKLDGSDVDILVLQYRTEHRLLLLARGDRVIVLSNPAMLLLPNPKNSEDWPQSKDTVEFIEELFSSEMSPFARHFLIDHPLPANTHSITLGARSFSLGYESLMHGLAALNLSFDNAGKWQSEALIGDVQDNGIWNTLPHGAGLCAALPVDWAQMGTLLDEYNQRSKQDSTELSRYLAGPAAVCWYRNSRLYTPLFAARLKPGTSEEQRQAFFDLFDRAVQGNQAGEVIRVSEIESRFGEPAQNGRFLKPAMTIGGETVFFSPDESLVAHAMKVSLKRYPSIADSFGKGADALLFIAPESLAGLLKKEIFAALPASEEALFRNAAEVYLLPGLESMARYPAQRVKLAPRKEAVRAGDSHAWRPLVWEAVR